VTTFPIGSLVKARNRKWVVVPGSDEQLLRLRPLGGVAEEECGICPILELVAEDSFPLPDPAKVGDARTSNLLRNAVRLSMRSTTGPFRSFARIAVEPRSYQFVPLLMALRKETVRLLIADDVGIGKTIEALLIARELLDRGEISRFCVLSPAHLCDQWVQEMNEKFHIDAVTVQPGTVARLERQCKAGQSLFNVFPFTVISIDYIKSDRHRHEFLQACPELVIVDEAHTCSKSGRGAQQHRYRLLRDLGKDEERHMVFVTATPHSGISEAFRSLLGLIEPSLEFLPEDLSGSGNEKARRQLAEYLVQRKRGDIESFLDEETPFPSPEEREVSYRLTPEYRAFLKKVLDFIFDTRQDNAASDNFKQKVRWWAALALLRCVVSSPVAGAAALRTKALGLTSTNEEEAQSLANSVVYDGDPGDEDAFLSDTIPGADTTDDQEGNPSDSPLRRRLQRLAKEAEGLSGPVHDHKLKFATKEIDQLVKDGFSPIVYCRFIHTAEYLGEHLRKKLKGAEVSVVTGMLHPSDRRQRVEELGDHPKRVLVATDCLSEGINLQEHFDSVFHYDLSWNPTRHEQRNGRVDRFGQPRPTVRSICYYGEDTMIDGAVLRVLIRKHREIKKSLGVSVPVPMDTKGVTDAMVEAIFLNRSESRQQLVFDDLLRESEQALHTEWEKTRDREKRSRTMFAQETLNKHLEDVGHELEDVRVAMGSTRDLAAFVEDAVQTIGGVVTQDDGKPLKLDLSEIPVAARQAIGEQGKLQVAFTPTASNKVLSLTRTHPFIQGLASFVADRSLSDHGKPVAARCGVMQTALVATRTTLLLVRMRFHLIVKEGNKPTRRELLEECSMLAFESSPANAEWISDPATLEELLCAEPSGNVPSMQQERYIQRVVDGEEDLRPTLLDRATQRAEEVLHAHQRVRAALERRRIRYEVTPELPVDVLGIYVYLPAEVR
jgi:hypothetical protein